MVKNLELTRLIQGPLTTDGQNSNEMSLFYTTKV
jgi:hypothetical protein